MSKNAELELDKRLEEGPIQKRSCTDVLCCLMFIAFLAVSGFFFVQKTQSGDFTKFMRPVDYDGNECGQGSAEKFPFLFFGRLNASEHLNPLENVVCVEKCPEMTSEDLNCYTNEAYNK